MKKWSRISNVAILYLIQISLTQLGRANFVLLFLYSNKSSPQLIYIGIFNLLSVLYLQCDDVSREMLYLVQDHFLSVLPVERPLGAVPVQAPKVQLQVQVSIWSLNFRLPAYRMLKCHFKENVWAKNTLITLLMTVQCIPSYLVAYLSQRTL